jgi:hypothetical protein
MHTHFGGELYEEIDGSQPNELRCIWCDRVLCSCVKPEDERTIGLMVLGCCRECGDRYELSVSEVIGAQMSGAGW